METNNQLVIIGDGETASLAYEYFSVDTDYTVCGFAVEGQYLRQKALFGRPVVALENIEERFPASEYAVFVAVSYTQLNRVRARLYSEVKRKGYPVASYVSSKAFIWRTVKIGENCFILEHNVLQHGVTIGNNVILWSGNHIGHQTVVHDHVYVASHAVVSGFCEIRESAFLGVNCCLNDQIKVARDCIIGSGAVVTRSTDAGKVYVGNPARALSKDSYATFGVKDK